MNRRQRGVLIATLVIAAGSAALLTWGPAQRESVARPVDPDLSYTQDAQGVHLVIRNRNMTWGLRNQRLEIELHDRREGFSIIRTYGPDIVNTYPPTNGRLPCCEIALLEPGGEYTFDLFPTNSEVYGIKIRLVDGEGWIPMTKMPADESARRNTQAATGRRP